MKNERLDAGILITNRETRIRGAGKGKEYCWIEMEAVTIFACYFSPNREIERKSGREGRK